MKKTLLTISLALIFALFSFSPLWAGNGGSGQGKAAQASQGVAARDGSMQNVDLGATVTISGVVFESGTPGSGMIIDEGNGQFTTIYGTGSLVFWNGLGIEKPAVGESVDIDAVEVVFSDGSTRLIAVAMTLEDGTIITLRDEDGRPAWRGGNGQDGHQGQGPGDGSGVCPLNPTE